MVAIFKNPFLVLARASQSFSVAYALFGIISLYFSISDLIGFGLCVLQYGNFMHFFFFINVDRASI